MNTFTCTNCGLPNPPNSSVCGRCGAPFYTGPGAPGTAWAPPSPIYQQPPQGKKRSTGVIVAIVIAAVVVIGVPVVGIVAAIAIPSLIRARAAANEAAAIGTLRSIASAEATYQGRNRKFATLSELVRADMIDATITNGVIRNGYAFREVKVTETSFEFSAEATDEVTSGTDSYNITEEFIIRSREGPVAPVGKSGIPLG